VTVRVGLALSGGGAKGLAHIGVLKVLEEAQIPVHLLAGTSMGGIVAALYAAGRSASEIEEIAHATRLLDVLQRDRSGLGLIGQDKMANRMRKALGGDLTFDQLKLPLALVATDLETGDEVIIQEGSVVEAVMATTAVPVIFPPVEWRGRLLADGGLLNQVPFDVVRKMGANRTVAVYTLRDLSGRPGDTAAGSKRGTETAIQLLIRRSRWGPMIDVAERSQCIMTRQQVERLVRQSPPDVMIEVTLNGVGLLDMGQVDVCVKAGEEAARLHLPELVKLRDTLPVRLARWWQSATSKLVEAVKG
jgi:NTE family protein